jgi:hypothetical protein
MTAARRDRDVVIPPERRPAVAGGTSEGGCFSAGGTSPAKSLGMQRTRILLLAAFGVTGCAEYAVGTMAEDSATIDDTGAENDGPSIRLDIYPSGATSWLSPQSYVPDGDGWEGLDVSLSSSVLVRGSISGFVANPNVGGTAPVPTVPGTDGAPVVARLTLSQRDGIGAATDWSADDGSFALRVPGGSAYTLVLAPEDPTSLPPQIVTYPLLEATTTTELTIDVGVPVYGQVLADGTTSLAGASVVLTRADGRAASEPLVLAEDGQFSMRALAGSYSLTVSGPSGSVVPTYSESIEVDEVDGLAVDLTLGDLTEVTVKGNVVDVDGETLRDVSMRVRFTSLTLNTAEGSLQVETEVDGDGFFAKPLLAGQWMAEFIPAYEESLAPTTFTFDAESGTVDLGEIAIPDPVQVSALVTDPSGAPAQGVLVSVREVGYDQNQWSTTTGVDGRFSLSLPPDAVVVTLTPDSNDGAITRYSLDAAASALAPQTLPYVLGDTVSGTLRSGDELISYALVELRGDDDTLYATTLSDADGNFTARVDWEGAR